MNEQFTDVLPTAFSVSLRARSIIVSRLIVAATFVMSFGLYFVPLHHGMAWVPEILIRTYLNFVAGVMAHEAVHGAMGTSRRTNLWWGRFALVPTAVPYVNFRLTHIEHHRSTNEPGKDPDAFLDTPHAWQIPFRAWAMPHQWIRWIQQKGKLTRAVMGELVATYAVYIVVHAAVATQVGVGRVLGSLLPAALLHSLLLWYPFAIKTHEGYSTGDEAERSHNYHGKLAFWFSFGLSLHRVHHLRPNLAWLQMLPLVPPCSLWQAITFRRDVQLPRA